MLCLMTMCIGYYSCYGLVLWLVVFGDCGWLLAALVGVGFRWFGGDFC